MREKSVVRQKERKGGRLQNVDLLENRRGRLYINLQKYLISRTHCQEANKVIY